MRRFFLKPDFKKYIAAALFSILTQIAFSFKTLFAPAYLRSGAQALYAFIGPQNPVLRFAVLFIFWFIVAWLVYTVVWLVEVLYVRAYNYIVLKTHLIR